MSIVACIFALTRAAPCAGNAGKRLIRVVQLPAKALIAIGVFGCAPAIHRRLLVLIGSEGPRASFHFNQNQESFDSVSYGMRTVKAEPSPGALRTEIVQFIKSSMRCTSARPRPFSSPFFSSFL